MRKLLEELFAMYYQDVYRYLYGLTRDAALAEDLASESFLEVVKSIATFRRESDIKTWLFSIARRRWFAYLRRQKRQINTEEYPFYMQAEGKPLDELFYDREMADRVAEILSQEQERVRRTVSMRMEGYSFCEIGKTLGISENSARVLYFRAKEKIRRILKEEGFE